MGRVDDTVGYDAVPGKDFRADGCEEEIDIYIAATEIAVIGDESAKAFNRFSIGAQYFV